MPVSKQTFKSKLPLVLRLIAYMSLMSLIGLHAWTTAGDPLKTHNFEKIFSVVEFALGVFGLCLAVEAAFSGRELLQELRAQVKRLVNLLSTKSVEAFPYHIDEIVLLVESLRRRDVFRVICDVSDYGSFFAPQSHGELHAALRTAVRQKGVQLDYLIVTRGTPFTRQSPLARFAKEVGEGSLTKECKEIFSRYLVSWIEYISSNSEVQSLMTDWRWLTDDKLEHLLSNAQEMTTKKLLPATEFRELIVNLTEEDLSMRERNYEEFKRSILEDGLHGLTKFGTFMLVRELALESELKQNQSNYKRVPAAYFANTPTFMWMTGRRGFGDSVTIREAIFIFNDGANFNDSDDIGSGVAFRTSNPELTSELNRIFDSYKKRSIVSIASAGKS